MSLIRFFHGCTQLGDITIFVGGMPVARQLGYGEATPHFWVSSGQTQIRVEENGVVRLQNHVIVPEGQTYTLLILCRSGFPEMLAIVEDGKLSDETMGGVRVGGFAASESKLDLWHRFQEQDELLFSEIEQGDVSEYVQLDPGEHRWEVREQNATISMLPGQTVDKGQLYTLYLIGKNDPEEEAYPLAIIMLPDMEADVLCPKAESTANAAGQ